MLKTIVATLHTVVMGSSLSQQSAIDTITLWRTKPAHELIFDSPRPDLYLQAVDKLQQSNGSNELISIAIERLKREFKAVLRNRQVEYPAAVGPSSTMDWTTTVTDSTAYLVRYEDYVGYDIPNRDVIVYLRNIVKILKANASVQECVEMYKSVRYKFLESQFRKLHFTELKIGDNLRRFSWDELKLKIDTWVRVSKICVEIFFRKEQQLCEEIFGKGLDSDSDSDSVFVETVRDFGVGLFGFAKVVSGSNQSYDKMGTVLGLYDAFWSILPDVEMLFGCESGQVIRDMCDDTRDMIQNEAGRMLNDLEKVVLNEISSVVDDAGRVCRTTEFVMELINHIVKHTQMLNDLVKSGPSPDVLDGVSILQADLGNVSSDHSFLDLHLRLIIAALRRSAGRKSNKYQDPSLAHLFRMNNVRYIVQTIEESKDLQQMVGVSYLKDLNETVESEMRGYCENTCSKFSDCLQEDGMYVIRCFRPSLSKPTMRKRLKTFNVAYEELKCFHTRWTVPDVQLRDAICSVLSKNLVPKYEDFLGKIGCSSQNDKIIKYSASEFEELILEKLFRCN